MLNLLTFFVGIVVIFLLARYNKSNKLFWILLISMMSGFIGGTIAANIGNNKESNVECVSQDLTLNSSMPTAQFLLPSNTEEVVPTCETPVVHYCTTESTTLSGEQNFSPLYGDGLVPFIFDSS
jgi:hypothetical protein